MTWENILKGSWGTSNFSILKQAALELIEELDVGEHTIVSLYDRFHEIMRSKTRGQNKRLSGYNNWAKNQKSEMWFTQKFPSIARNAGLVVFITNYPSRVQAVRKE